MCVSFDFNFQLWEILRELQFVSFHNSSFWAICYPKENFQKHLDLFLVIGRALVFEHGYSSFTIAFVKKVNFYNLHISSRLPLLNYFISVRYIWYKVFKNGPYKLFKGRLPKILLGPILNTLPNLKLRF